MTTEISPTQGRTNFVQALVRMFSLLASAWSLPRTTFIAVFCLALTPLEARAADVTCDCEEAACGPCEIETGTTFYSSKCGPANSRVKSCKKVTCEPVDNQKQCLALFNANKTEVPSGVASDKPETPQASFDRAASRKSRAPASAGQASAPAGSISDVVGWGNVTRARGGSERARRGLSVFQGDLLETRSDGKIAVSLNDGSEMTLPPNSRVRLDQVSVDASSDSRKVALSLLMGKVRNRVTKKVDDSENYFRVRTRTAVAGVRGTDFVASFEPGPKEWITEIRTIEGRVKLGPPRPEEGEEDPVTGSASGQSIEVEAERYAAYIVEAPPRGADEAEVARLAMNGFLTPVFKMKDEDLRLLKDAIDLKPLEAQRSEAKNRSPANSVSTDVCKAPSGQYNQCAWSCEGRNPKGDKRCRVDLPGVACVRRLCRANGQWAEASRVPASQSDLCEPQGPTVRDCGGYW